MEISHLTQSSAALVPNFFQHGEPAEAGFVEACLHMLMYRLCVKAARGGGLMGDMWQCPCVCWQDTLRVSVSESQGGWVVVEGVRSPTYGLTVTRWTGVSGPI